MSYFLLWFYSFGGIIFGVLSSGVFFYFKGKEKYFKWLKECTSYKHAFESVVKDLDRELSVRKNVEQRLRNNEEILKKLYAKLAISEDRLSSMISYQKKYDDISSDLYIQRERNIVQEEKIKQILSSLEEKNFEILEKEKLFFNFEKRLSDRFEILINRVFDFNESKIDAQNKLSLDNILSPLRVQLDGFSQEISRKFSQEECERHTLSHEIRNLQCLNVRMMQETINLTSALKGNSKIQGNWGEVILNRVLEASGMREGHEFYTQTNVRTDNGRYFHPDVVVHLPDNKVIIIDAKTSLLGYERYFNSDDHDERKIALSEHIASLRSHMKSLAKKDYQSLYDSVQTLEYVLMFVPIESAFTVALSKESSLLTEAIEQKIMLVSPSTLLIALRIINNLWSHEYQNRHAKEIADRASRLYDKFRLFVDDINKIGQHLDKVHISYSLAKNKLYNGSGNLISQAEKFRVFGVKIKRPIISQNKSFSSSSFSK